MLGRWEGSGGEGRGGEREGGGVIEETGKAETQEKGRQISSLGIITLNIKGTQKTVSFCPCAYSSSCICPIQV